MAGHPKSGMEVDVSLYKVVGGRAMRRCYDYTDTATAIHTFKILLTGYGRLQNGPQFFGATLIKRSSLFL